MRKNIMRLLVVTLMLAVVGGTQASAGVPVPVPLPPACLGS
jgi:hypothetical protein